MLSNKKYIITAIILLFSVFATAQFQKVQSSAQKFAQVLFYIDQMYVDTTNIDNLTETAIVEMLQSLDPHSSYIPKEEVEAMNEHIVGNFEGIGISYNIFNDTLHVIQTIAGCPSEKVGILPGDRIIKVEDKTIAGVNIKRSEIPKLLRGPKGSKVHLTIERKGMKDLLSFTVERDKIPLYSVDAAYMINQETAYIKINSFSVTTTEEVNKALDSLSRPGMRNLIIDLQGNGGGVMSAAIDLVDQFLDANKLIVYTQGEHQRRSDATSTSKGKLKNGDIYVLIDEYSASASEITAGALQDWDRATIIGRRSFGKGLVQRPIPLGDGSEMRLTVARYYTPSGRNIQKPYTDGAEKYYKDLTERYEHGEMMNEDSVTFPDSLKYKTLILGRTVYGGGGIWPDVFVPLDTTPFSPYYRSVLAKGILLSETAAYTESSRNEILETYPTFDLFYKNYNVPNELLDRMITKASEEKIQYNANEFERSKDFMTKQIKAIIARSIYTPDTYYRVINDYNQPLIKALQLIKEKK